MQDQNVSMVKGRIVKLSDKLLLSDSQTFYRYFNDKLMSRDIKTWYARWILARELLFVYKGISATVSTSTNRFVSYHTFMRGRQYH